MSAGEEILARLAARQRVGDRVVVVAAHPDDETIGLGAQLRCLDDALLVHVTDGAPRDGHDAAAYGFATLADYEAARRRELAAALTEGGADHLRTLCLGIVDQEAMHRLASLARHLRELFLRERPQAVVTHAYEGGHPDHDAAAFAVHAACRLMAEPPAILEMALYHRREGRLVSGKFLRPPAEHCCVAIELNEEEIRRKQRMIDCFTTQRWLLTQLDSAVEWLRIAPGYDFRTAPHRGELHYETLGWGITSVDWRRNAAAALAELGLVKLGREQRQCR
jgi:LmbE family N-acetylglucosaminyl deacetylase